VTNYATLCLRLFVRIEELTLDRKVRQSVASEAAIQTWKTRIRRKKHRRRQKRKEHRTKNKLSREKEDKPKTQNEKITRIYEQWKKKLRRKAEK
jgi:hypothetical protein